MRRITAVAGLSLLGGLLLIIPSVSSDKPSPDEALNHPHYSRWQALPARNSDDALKGLKIGSFRLQRPGSELFLGGLQDTVYETLSAVPPKRNELERYLQARARARLLEGEQPETFKDFLQRRTEGLGERLLLDSADYATDTLNALATNSAQGLGFVRNVEFDIQAPLGKRRGQGGLSALGALRETDADAVVWQLRGYAAEEDSAGANAGLIYRRAMNVAGESLVGANVFLDYEVHGESDENFWRWSLGGEYRNAYIDLYANRYFAISDPVTTRNGVYYTADGTDAELNVNLGSGLSGPLSGVLSGGLGYYSWEGIEGDNDDEGLRYHLRFSPERGRLQIELQLDVPEEGGEQWGGRVSYRHIIGEAASGGGGVSAERSFDARAHFFDVVRREYAQRIRRVEINPNTFRVMMRAGTAVVNATAPNAAAAEVITLTAGAPELTYNRDHALVITVQADSTLYLNAGRDWGLIATLAAQFHVLNASRRISVESGTVVVSRNSDVTLTLSAGGSDMVLLGTRVEMGTPGGTMRATVNLYDGRVSLQAERAVLLPIIRILELAEEIRMALEDAGVPQDDDPDPAEAAVVVTNDPDVPREPLMVGCSSAKQRANHRIIDGEFAGCAGDMLIGKFGDDGSGGQIQLIAQGEILTLSSVDVPDRREHAISYTSGTVQSPVKWDLFPFFPDGAALSNNSGDYVYLLHGIDTAMTAGVVIANASTVQFRYPPAAADPVPATSLTVNMYVRHGSVEVGDQVVSCADDGGSRRQVLHQLLVQAACGNAVTGADDLQHISGRAVTGTILTKTFVFGGGDGEFRFQLSPETGPLQLINTRGMSATVALISVSVAGPQRYELVASPSEALAGVDIAPLTVTIDARVYDKFTAVGPAAPVTFRTLMDGGDPPADLATVEFFAVGAITYESLSFNGNEDFSGLLAPGFSYNSGGTDAASRLFTIQALQPFSEESDITVSIVAADAYDDTRVTAVITLQARRPGDLIAGINYAAGINKSPDGYYVFIRAGQDLATLVAANDGGLSGVAEAGYRYSIVSPSEGYMIAAEGEDGSRGILRFADAANPPPATAAQSVIVEIKDQHGSEDGSTGTRHLTVTLSLALTDAPLALSLVGELQREQNNGLFAVDHALFTVDIQGGLGGESREIIVENETLPIVLAAGNEIRLAEPYFFTDAGSEEVIAMIVNDDSGESVSLAVTIAFGGGAPSKIIAPAAPAVAGATLATLSVLEATDYSLETFNPPMQSLQEGTAVSNSQYFALSIHANGRVRLIQARSVFEAFTVTVGVAVKIPGMEVPYAHEIEVVWPADHHAINPNVNAGKDILLMGQVGDGGDDVWLYQDGAGWTQRAGVSGFGAVQGIAGLADSNNRLYLLGGLSNENGGKRLLGMFSSDNGAAWRSLQNEDFGDRFGAAAVFHRGSLYYIGGNVSGNRQNDVAAAAGDGSGGWVPRAGAPKFEVRENAAAVSHRGSLFVIGGQNERGGWYSDVWVSSDGAAWQRLTGQTPFGARNHHAAVSFGGKIYVVGGVTGRHSTADVWSSVDGQVWRREGEIGNGIINIRDHAVVARGGRMLLIGGRKTINGVFGLTSRMDHKIYASTDGKTWTVDKTLSPDSGHPGQVYEPAVFLFDASSRFGSGVPKKVIAPGAPSPAGVVLATLSVAAASEYSLVSFKPGEQSVQEGRPIPNAVYLTLSAHADGSARLIQARPVFEPFTITVDVRIRAPSLLATKEIEVVWPENPNAIDDSVNRGKDILLMGNVGDDNDDIWLYRDGVGWFEVAAASPFGWRNGMDGLVGAGSRLYAFGGNGSGSSLLGIWSSADGEIWQEVDNGDFGAREGAAAVFHAGSLYYIGGRQSDRPQNDVGAAAEDGSGWTQRTGEAEFAARAYHAAVSHRGSLIVIGGEGSDGGYHADVWASSDGSRWERLTDLAEFGGRSEQAAVSFGGKIYVVGGINGDDNGDSDNAADVWSSLGGKVWRYEGEIGNGINRISGHRLVARGGRMLLIGGQKAIDGEDHHADHKIYASTDGKTWTVDETLSPDSGHPGQIRWPAAFLFDAPALFSEVAGEVTAPPAPVPAGAVLATIAVAGATGYSLATFAPAAQSIQEGKPVDSSLYFTLSIHSDGGARLIQTRPVFEALKIIVGVKIETPTLSAVKNIEITWPNDPDAIDDTLNAGKDILIMGNVGNDNDDIWLYQDGAGWTRVAAAPPFNWRNGMDGLTGTDNRLYAFGGTNGGTGLGIWSSADGKGWQPVDNDDFGARDGVAAVFHAGSLYYTGGAISEHVQEDVGAAAGDGSGWTRRTSEAEFGARTYHAAVSHRGSLFVIGGENSDGDYKSDVFVSSDGSIWDPLTSEAPFGERHDMAAVSFGGKIYVIGGIDGEDNEDSDIPADVWSSVDGEVWRYEGEIGNGIRKISGHRLVARGGKMLLIGGQKTIDGNPHDADHRIYASTDGKTWTVDAVLSPDSEHPGEIRDPAVFLFDAPFGDITRTYTVSGAPVAAGAVLATLTVAGATLYSLVSFAPKAQSIQEGRPVDNSLYFALSVRSDGSTLLVQARSVFEALTITVGLKVETPDTTDTIPIKVVWPNDPNAIDDSLNADKDILVMGEVGDGYDDIWAYRDGTGWTQVAAASPFGTRFGMAGLTGTDNRLYVFGGKGKGGDLGIWSSADGGLWQEVNNGIFGGRYGAAAAFHKGSLYYFGGSRVALVSDVGAASGDGRGWTYRSGRAEFGNRYYAEAVSHRGSLYVIGGSGYYRERSDVWVSSDGRAWRRLIEHAPFGIRNLKSALSFGGKIYVVGGADGDGHEESENAADVWSSVDGKIWRYEGEIGNGIHRISGHRVIARGGRMLLIGGQKTIDGALYHADHKIYASTDGKTWTLDTTLSPDTGNPGPIWRSAAFLFNIPFGEIPEEITAPGAPVPAGAVLATLSAAAATGYSLVSFAPAAQSVQEGVAVANSLYFTLSMHSDGSARLIQARPVFEALTITVGVRIESAAATATKNIRVVWPNDPEAIDDTVNAGKDILVMGNIGHGRDRDDIWLYQDGSGWVQVAATSPFGWRNRMGGLVGTDNRLYVFGGRGPGNHREGLRLGIYSSDNGKDWNRVSNDDFGNRHGVAAVFHEGNLYYIGGSKSNNAENRAPATAQNDVGVAAGDGSGWARRAGTPKFNERESHMAVSHRGSLFVIGGNRNGYYFDEHVWVSSDGGVWELLVEEAPFSHRDYSSAVSFGGKIYIVGGSDGDDNSESNILADVWSSVDGKIWRREGEIGNGIRKISGHRLVVRGGRMLLIGGSKTVGNNNFYTDHRIYASTDGKTWTLDRTLSPNSGYPGKIWDSAVFLFDHPAGRAPMKVTAPGAPAAAGAVLATISAKSATYSLVSFAPAAQSIQEGVAVSSALYFTLSVHSDGSARLVQARSVFEVLTITVGVEVKLSGLTTTKSIEVVWPNDAEAIDETVNTGKDMLIIGNVGSDGDDIWKYGNSAGWSEVTSASPFGRITGLAGLTGTNGRFYLFGGLKGDNSRLSIWTSANGETWDLVDNDVFGTRHQAAAVFHKGSMYFMGGMNALQSNAVGAAAGDGSGWALRAGTPKFTARAAHAAVSHRGSLFVIGGHNRGVNPIFYRDVWVSSDGGIWERLTGNARFGHRGHLAAASFGGKIYVVGGINAADNAAADTAADVWSSVDGKVWRREGEIGNGINRISGHELIVRGGKMLLIGGSKAVGGNNEHTDHKIYASTDGKTWTEEPGLSPGAGNPGAIHNVAVFFVSPNFHEPTAPSEVVTIVTYSSGYDRLWSGTFVGGVSGINYDITYSDNYISGLTVVADKRSGDVSVETDGNGIPNVADITISIVATDGEGRKGTVAVTIHARDPGPIRYERSVNPKKKIGNTHLFDPSDLEPGYELLRISNLRHDGPFDISKAGSRVKYKGRGSSVKLYVYRFGSSHRPSYYSGVFRIRDYGEEVSVIYAGGFPDCNQLNYYHAIIVLESGHPRTKEVREQFVFRACAADHE